MLFGCATHSGTLEYAGCNPELSYRSLGRTGLIVSEAGFGGYRVDAKIPEHCQALAYALRSGVNLIDTSANYADGGSERLVGSVLTELVRAEVIRRQEIVVVSKGGYLQGENYQISQEWQAEGRAFPDLVHYAEELEHCIHPDFLADQISRSIERLGIETIDCYLLHNPEYYLNWAEQQSITRIDAQHEYLRRIRAAFIYLETEVAKGRISCYGISSNTFVSPQQEYNFTPLAKIWDLAVAISPDHHFRVVEFPCNLFETGAITEANQPGSESALAFAVRQGLGVLINRPLNAIKGNQLIRLSEDVYKGNAAREAREFRKRVAALDGEWQSAPSLRHLALQALRSTEGITTVLIGMRKLSYVDDVLQVLRKPCAVAERKSVWEQVQRV
ncbi:hypothetical protein SDC9_20833 [bioreactor metagenome]|uniref:NADP-dependent oxidoreductase domain-containing protein n=1 Tax=bioreactor metagenome TaxID=1076179 RepID=A0A644U7U3_9ZZZZ|nr:aldo/keto reductase [Negativicutes bacterium]